MPGSFENKIEALKSVLFRFGASKYVIAPIVDAFSVESQPEPDYNIIRKLCMDVPEIVFIVKKIVGSFVDALADSQDSSEDLDMFEKQIYSDTEKWLFNTFFIITCGADACLISALAGEAYESRATDNHSMVFVPHGNSLDEAEATYWFNKELTEELSYENIRGVRKLLEITKKDQYLITQPNEAGILHAVGFVKFKPGTLAYPMVSFDGKMQWSFHLPRDAQHPSTCLFRVSNGCFKLPAVNCEKLMLNDLTKYLSSFQPSVADGIIDFLDLVQKQKHGTSMVWLSADDAANEVDRLCIKNHRGYVLNTAISSRSDADKGFVESITSIDGALLCSIDDLQCLAYGVILDGRVSPNALCAGTRSRGARYNSLRTYIDDRSELRPGSPAFAIVISEDGMIDLLLPSKQNTLAAEKELALQCT